MRIFALVVLAFVAGAAVGWLLAMGGYIAQTEWFGVHDQDGGGAMAYGLIIGPLAGLFLGTLLAAFTALRLTSRTKPDVAR
jgi:Na+/melibiose symporter-like transporter